MVYKFGIIGLPNVGKSALFNKLTKLNIPSKNFPFCTINPNIGTVPVIDTRLKKIADCISSQKKVYSFIQLVDIAGLVKGASSGEGLGNKFLEKIRECHAVIHVVRVFKGNDVIHIYDYVDPFRDIDIVNTELLLSDLEICEKINQKFLLTKSNKSLFSTMTMNLIQRCINQLKLGCALRDIIFSHVELKQLKSFQFLTLKPMIYVLNMMDDIHENIDLRKFFQDTKINKLTIFPIIGNNDKKINNTSDMQVFLRKNSISYTNDYNQVIRIMCSVLRLQTFFTAGLKETRSWLFQAGSTAVQAAKLIHSDFSKGFIRAQVVSYYDFINSGSIDQVKKIGKMRSEGKKYIIQDGDVINFLFNI